MRLDASPNLITLLFAAYGISGAVGSVISSLAIGKLGAAQTVSVHLFVVMIGLAVWAVGGSSLALAAAGLIILGYGGGPAISGQQARLIMADTNAASASVALNTSVLYAGQAVGANTGGLLLSHQHIAWNGYVGTLLLLIALTVSWSVRRWLHA
jgi:predicted MFS family arabinose efflux permease